MIMVTAKTNCYNYGIVICLAGGCLDRMTDNVLALNTESIWIVDLIV
jgi:hypothetical protein